MYKTKEAHHGVSTYMFCMKNSSNLLWVAFGLISGTYAIVFWNLVSATLSASVLILKWKYKNNVKAQKAAELIYLVPSPMPELYFDDIEPEVLKSEASKPKIRLVVSNPSVNSSSNRAN
jgi:hypothetical protein